MNVLLTCAGRRTSLLRLFGEAVHASGGVVLAGDADNLAPTLALADRAVRLPRLSDKEYLRALVRVVHEHEVGLVVPTIDTELPLLAAGACELQDAGANVLISTAEFVSVCADKWLTCAKFGKQGVAVPRSWLPESFDPPPALTQLIVKPRAGSASKDVHSVSIESAAAVAAQVDDAIIQERLVGPEITIDALFHPEDGVPLHYVPRERIRTLGGESIQGRTIDDSCLRAWLIHLMHVASDLGARGPVTFQAFLTDSGPVLIEANARFGGGFPLSDAAGGHYPAWVVAMAGGQSIRPDLGNYTRGLFMTRYSAEQFTSELPW